MYTTLLTLSPRDATDEAGIRRAAARSLGIAEATISATRIRRQSIDARQRDVKVRMEVEVYVGETPGDWFEPIDYPDVEGKPAAVIAGAGPAGLFAALKLIDMGIRPIVLERGKDVHERKRDIAAISRLQEVNPESNYSFGEGGAGTYSDGKLYTRSKKRGSVERILQIFCQAGADYSILYAAHPHIGTDRLPRIIETMRRTIIDHGGEVHFETRVTALLTDSSGAVTGVRDAAGSEYAGPVILATGHSARDVYRMLHSEGYTLEQKGLAVGVRLEHPSFVIDCLQYHSRNGRGQWLPAAEYSMAVQVEGRGVYSFCMCPGGFVVPAASGADMVVEMRPEDLNESSIAGVMATAMSDEQFAARHTDAGEEGNPLRMMYFQEALERECWLQGNRRQTAPAQRMGDFVNRRLSSDLPASSYATGLIASPLHFWLPAFISSRLASSAG